LLAYYGTRLSPHMDKTPEGYLICRDVPIARTGTQVYAAGELGLDGDPGRAVTVERHPEDVFEPEAMASFEGKDVTAGHPPEQVGPENHAHYSKGHVQRVRRDGDKLAADLLIKDAALISDVENGVLREVSCGYLCEYVPEGDGFRQRHIRGNHVAVVPRGRAGHEVAIQDAAGTAEKGRKCMGKFAEAILTALGMAAKEAEDEEQVKALAAKAAMALDAAPEDKSQEGGKPEETPAGDACGAQDEMVEKAPNGDDLGSKLDKVIAMLAGLEKKNDREEKALRDEKTLDSLLDRLERGSGSVTLQADAAPLELLRRMRPAVAAIPDREARARVVDALLDGLDGGVMDQLQTAAEQNAKKALDAAKPMSFEDRCREAEAAYAARNPHKKKED